MSTVTDNTSSVNIVQFDAALRGLAERARTRYAGEAARIDRGLVLALNGAVTLHADGTASVQSASHPEIVYTVNGHCDCPDASRAPEGRCKHRWAACLVKKARTLALRYEAARYFATYTAPDGTEHAGIATRTGQGWLFVAEDGLEPLFASSAALALGGNVAIYEAKRAEDEAAGGLVAIVCGYGQGR